MNDFVFNQLLTYYINNECSQDAFDMMLYISTPEQAARFEKAMKGKLIVQQEQLGNRTGFDAGC
jgi:hypothetical protein